MKKISIFKPLFFILSFSFIFLLFFRPIETGDIWWHLKTGEWVIENDTIPDYDIFSHLENPTKGVSLQWLGSTMYYSIYKYAGGFNGLKIFRSVFILGVFLIIFFYFRNQMPFYLLITVAFLILLSILSRHHLRPYLLNYMYVQLLLICCLKYSDTINWRYLFPIPLIGMLWFNTHMGSVIYGLPILGAFVLQYGSCVVQQLCDKKRIVADSLATKKLNAFGIVLGCYIISFFINPYGLKGFLYPFKVFADPTFISFYKLQAIITELRPPEFIFTLRGWPVHILLILTSILFFCDKKRRLSLVILFIFSFFFYLRYTRAGLFFTLIASYSILDSSSRVFCDKPKQQFLNAVFGLLFLTFVAFQTVAWCTEKVVLKDKNVFYFLEHRSYDNPTPTIEFMKNHGLTGRIFNSGLYGGALIWESYPLIMPFADNRQYDLQLYGNYIEILKNPERLWPRAVNDYGFQVVILDTSHSSSKLLQQYLHHHQDWCLVFFEKDSVVFVHKSHPSFKSGIVRSLNESLGRIELQQKDFLTLQQVGAGNVMSSPSFFHYRYVEPFREGIVLLMDFNYMGAGVKKVIESLPYLEPNYAKTVARAVLEFIDKKKP